MLRGGESPNISGLDLDVSRPPQRNGLSGIFGKDDDFINNSRLLNSMTRECRMLTEINEEYLESSRKDYSAIKGQHDISPAKSVPITSQILKQEKSIPIAQS